MRRFGFMVAVLLLSAAVVRGEEAKETAKKVMTEHVELLKGGDLEKLKATFTARQRDKITAEMMEKGKAGASKFTIDELVAGAEAGKFEGKDTIKIKMANGRTLTTLVQTDGKWLADTIWFK